MTRAGTVAEQPPMPSKTNVGRLRDAGAQKEIAGRKNAAAPSDDVEKQFGELLAKLNSSDDEGSVRSGSTEESSRSANSQHAHQRKIALRFARDEQNGKGGDGSDGAADDCASGDDLRLGKDRPADGKVETSQSNVAPTLPSELDKIAASVTATVMQQSNGRDSDEQSRSSKADRGPGAAKPSKAILDASLGQAEAKETPVSAQAQAGARMSVPEAAVAKGQLRQDEEGRPLASAKLDPASMSDEGQEPPAKVDLPKAHVQRRETHFAPVASPTTSSQSRTVAAEGGQSNVAANGTEPGAAATGPTDAASLGPEGPVSIAAPPARQIADRIVAEVPAFAAAGRAGAAADQPGAAPVLKIVQIQLQPADLGTVTVRIELKAADMKLHVETDRADTADIIRGDQDTLTKLLRSAGYSVDAGSIRITEGDKTVVSAQAGQQGAQTGMQSSTQSNPGGSERQESAQRGHRDPHGGNTQTQSDRNETHGTVTNRTGRDLYI
jgi:Flagellar hook-length control protein FliK